MDRHMSGDVGESAHAAQALDTNGQGATRAVLVADAAGGLLWAAWTVACAVTLIRLPRTGESRRATGE